MEKNDTQISRYAVAKKAPSHWKKTFSKKNPFRLFVQIRPTKRSCGNFFVNAAIDMVLGKMLSGKMPPEKCPLENWSQKNCPQKIPQTKIGTRKIAPQENSPPEICPPWNFFVNFFSSLSFIFMIIFVWK